MNVHVDHVGRHFKRQQRDRIAACHQQPTVGLTQGVLQSPVADEAAVEKQVLHPVVAAALARMGHVAGEPHLAVGTGDRDQAVGQPPTYHRGDPLQPSCIAGQLKYIAVVVPEREVDLRVGQRQSGEGLVGVTELGLRGPQELSAHWGVEKQAANFDRRADRASARRNARAGAADYLDLGPALAIGRSATQRQPAHLGYRGQCLAAEPERADAEQVVGLRELAGSVTGHGQLELVGRDAVAVVDHADHLHPAGGDRNVDPRRPGVDRILHQLLNHAGRPLDHLTGGDFIDQGLGKTLNIGHGGAVRRDCGLGIRD